jgi:hypothetical protein
VLLHQRHDCEVGDNGDFGGGDPVGRDGGDYRIVSYRIVFKHL